MNANMTGFNDYQIFLQYCARTNLDLAAPGLMLTAAKCSSTYNLDEIVQAKGMFEKKFKGEMVIRALPTAIPQIC